MKLMKPKNLSMVFILLITGCSQYNNTRQDSHIAPILSNKISPSVNVESTASLGDYVMYNQLISTLKTDMVTLGNASGAMSEIKAGNYCNIGGDVYKNFDTLNAVGLKNVVGKVVSYTDSVKYDRTNDTISPPNTTTFNSKEISIKFTPNADCHVVKEIVQSISFNGKRGDDLMFIYSESYPYLKKESNEFSVPISDAKVKVQYKNLAFKVVEVEGTTLRYIVLPSN
ncbi:hypothetical protein [Edwardsiella tarda]|uniref:hypothetical protein n=1 Tax=Edwardsiella tarda TaxID=636 RepID=UPI00351C4165